MKKIFSIATYTLRQNIRNRVYYILVFFAVILIFVYFILSVLGGEESLRIILDFGLATVEFFALLLIIFSGVSLILEEIESKTIYLVLVRPIPKWYYITGRYIGLVLSSYIGMIIMYLIHCAILFYKGWSFDINYLYAVISSFMKIAIIGSLAVFFSLFSTSSASSLVFTFFLWLLGHFTSEIKFLIKKAGTPLLKILLEIFYFIIPNLQYFNWRDFLGSGISSNWFFIAFFYGVSYSLIFLILSIILFNKKEF